jgi:cation diffusion facilitator family transporter
MQNRTAIIRTASIVSLAGNLLLAVTKIVGGYFSGSLAVVSDGIDSSIDVLISAISLVISKLISRPADEGHPWGHGRAESVATVMLAFLLAVGGVQLLISAGNSFIAAFSSDASSAEVPGKLALVITIISIVGKAALALNQYLLGKKAASGMLLANAKNMCADIAISGAVLVGLFFAITFNISFIDIILAFVIGVIVIKESIGIFISANSELMDGGSGTEDYRNVFDAVKSVEGAGNPHRTRIRKIAGFYDIDIDIEVDGNLTVTEAHKISEHVESAIRNKLSDVYDIVVHIEPAGECRNSGDEYEAYGLRETDIK